MLVTTEKRKETGTGLMGDTEYSFEVGPHMMEILSGLYSNPDHAMVREYLTNMYDAHIALYKATGKWGPKPVLTLPTMLTPILQFADKGIGMSAESVQKIYTRYGKSTKSDCNDEVGGFGLGAKVAFAYNGGCDWTVESRFGGEKNTFVARIGPNGMPVLSHISTTKTNEHSGTTVTIPVRKQDIPRIQDAAKQYIRHFPIDLEVINSTFPTERLVADLFGEKWSASKADYHHQEVTVIVGNVPYVVGDNELNTCLTTAGMNKGYFWKNNAITIQLPVGSVDIVPSRDNLKYTDKTRNTIIEALKSMAKEIPIAASKMVAGAKTEYDALKMMLDFTSLSYVEEVLTKVTYKGIDLTRGAGITRKVTDFPGTTFFAYGIADSESSAIAEVDCTSTVSLKADDTTTLMIDDVAKGQIRAAKVLAFQKLVSKTPAGRASRWGRHKVGHVIVVKTNLTKQELSDKFGGYPVERMEAVSTYRAAKAPSGARVSAENIYKFSGQSWSSRVRVPSDGVVRYYLPLTKGYNRFTFKDSSDLVRRHIRNAQFLKMLGAPDYELYGIRADETDKYDDTLWINLETAIATGIIGKVQNDAMQFSIYEVWKDRIGTFKHQATMLESLDMYPTINAFLLAHKTIADAVESVSDVMQLVNNYMHTPEMTRAWAGLPKCNVASPDLFWNKITTQYPMLAVLINSVKTMGYYRSAFDEIVPNHKEIIKKYLDSCSP